MSKKAIIQFFIPLITVTSVYYFFQKKEYSAEAQNFIVHADTEEVYAKMQGLKKSMNGRDFKRVLKDVIANNENDLRSLEAALTYAAEDTCCDCIDLIDKKIAALSKKTGTTWQVKISEGAYKQYGFKDSLAWVTYKSDFIDYRLSKLRSACNSQ